MGVWDIYEERISNSGATKREAILNRTKRSITSKMPDNLSSQEVLINGVPQTVAIIDSDNLNQKKILSLPDEDFDCGDMIEWAGSHWMITEKDANTEVRAKGLLLQCNYLLKWIDEDDNIIEQWCYVEDGTKYLTGEYEDRLFITTRGDSRIAITISRNEHTVKLGRTNRFIIDDSEREDKLAYVLSKPLRFGKTYNGKGVFGFVCQEVVTTDDDNIELCIADYYKHFPRTTAVDPSIKVQIDSNNTNNGKKVWL